MSEPMPVGPERTEPASVTSEGVGSEGVESEGVGSEGGDAACWANRVCPECGRLNDAERPEICEACGAEFG